MGRLGAGALHRAIRSAEWVAARELIRRLLGAEGLAASILFAGDSLTAPEAYGASDTAHGWAHLAVEGQLSEVYQPITKMAVTRNVAIGGQGIDEMPQRIAAASVCFILGGTNDIAFTAITGPQLFAKAILAHERALSYGCYRTIAATIPASTQITAGAKENARLAFNALMRAADGPWSAFVDFGLYMTTDDTADGTHWDDDGHIKAANLAVPVFNTVLRELGT